MRWGLSSSLQNFNTTNGDLKTFVDFVNIFTCEDGPFIFDKVPISSSTLSSEDGISL